MRVTLSTTLRSLSARVSELRRSVNTTNTSDSGAHRKLMRALVTYDLFWVLYCT